jgi:hypothetical protein
VQIIIANKTTGPPTATEDDSERTDNFRKAILEFLNSASTYPRMNCCPDCGSQLEYRDYTFSYEGATWEISLPFCFNCGSNSEAYSRWVSLGASKGNPS